MLKNLNEHQDTLEKITPLLSLVSAALLIPSIFSSLGGELTEDAIVSLVGYLLTVAAAVLLFLPKVDRKVMLPVANVLFYGSIAFRHVYSAIAGSLSAYPTAALYAAVALLIFIPPCKKAYALTSLVAIAFFLASALGGGAINLSTLLLSLVIAVHAYFITEKE